MKIERLLAITVMLLNRRKVTANELAEHFEVSPRTIYRDLDTLNGAGIPIISSAGYEGGFCIPDNYKLSRQLLTFDDMVSILTTLKGVNSSLKNRDIDRIIEKFTSLIPSDKQDIYKRKRESFIIDIGPWGRPQQNDTNLQLIHKAIDSSQLLQFHYTGAQGKKSLRRVEPHTLVFKSFNWYLLAYCHLRLDFRVFRLSRFRQIIILDDHFDRRAVVPQEYFLPENDSRSLIEIVLLFHPEIQVKVEEIFEKNQLTYNEDKSITATFQMPDNEWVLSFVLSFGDSVEILSPSFWRQALQEKLEKIQKIYSNMT